MSDAYSIALEVLQERARQDSKWGEQNHQDGTNYAALRDLALSGLTANEAKENYEALAGVGRVTWADILWEEFAEAMEEADPAKLREELKQVAAVAMAWMQCIDRRSSK